MEEEERDKWRRGRRGHREGKGETNGVISYGLAHQLAMHAHCSFYIQKGAEHNCSLCVCM